MPNPLPNWIVQYGTLIAQSIAQSIGQCQWRIAQSIVQSIAHSMAFIAQSDCPMALPNNWSGLPNPHWAIPLRDRLALLSNPIAQSYCPILGHDCPTHCPINCPIRGLDWAIDCPIDCPIQSQDWAPYCPIDCPKRRLHWAMRDRPSPPRGWGFPET